MHMSGLVYLAGKVCTEFLPTQRYALVWSLLTKDGCLSVRLSHAGIVSKHLNPSRNFSTIW